MKIFLIRILVHISWTSTSPRIQSIHNTHAQQKTSLTKVNEFVQGFVLFTAKHRLNIDWFSIIIANVGGVMNDEVTEGRQGEFQHISRLLRLIVTKSRRCVVQNIYWKPKSSLWFMAINASDCLKAFLKWNAPTFPFKFPLPSFFTVLFHHSWNCPSLLPIKQCPIQCNVASPFIWMHQT